MSSFTNSVCIAWSAQRLTNEVAKIPYPVFDASQAVTHWPNSSGAWLTGSNSLVAFENLYHWRWSLISVWGSYVAVMIGRYPPSAGHWYTTWSRGEWGVGAGAAGRASGAEAAGSAHRGARLLLVQDLVAIVGGLGGDGAAGRELIGTGVLDALPDPLRRHRFIVIRLEAVRLERRERRARRLAVALPDRTLLNIGEHRGDEVGHVLIAQLIRSGRGIQQGIDVDGGDAQRSVH